MRTLLASLVAFLLSVFTVDESPEARHLASARRMMRIARADKALGYHYAAKAAVQSALAYRAAAHAHRRIDAQIAAIRIKRAAC